MLLSQAVLTLMAVCITQAFAQDVQHYPPNTGIYKDVIAPLSPTTRFWASDRGKEFLLHSSFPGALGLLHWFHPDAVSQYPQEPLRKAPSGRLVKPSVTSTGCGTTTAQL
jgi:hypothetical protein